MTSAHPASCSLLPHLLLALIALFANASAFDPTHVHLLDSYRLPTGQTNLLFRGGTPLNGDNFDTQALMAAMTTVASAVRVFVVDAHPSCPCVGDYCRAFLPTNLQVHRESEMFLWADDQTLCVAAKNVKLRSSRRNTAYKCTTLSVSLSISAHIRRAAASPT